jgi:hypothetical protein
MIEYIKSFLLSLIIVISPIKEAVLAISFLIFVDFIFGFLASRKLKEKFQFSKLESTAIKAIVYNLLLACCFFSEEYLVNFVPLVKVCLSFVCYLELTSISKSFEKITGLSFINYLRDFIKNQIHKKG